MLSKAELIFLSLPSACGGFQLFYGTEMLHFNDLGCQARAGLVLVTASSYLLDHTYLKHISMH